MQIITKDDEVKELARKNLYEKSKKLPFIKAKLSNPTEEQEQWFENRMFGSAKSWKRWYEDIYFTEEQKKEMNLP